MARVHRATSAALPVLLTAWEDSAMHWIADRGEVGRCLRAIADEPRSRLVRIYNEGVPRCVRRLQSSADTLNPVLDQAEPA